MIAAIVILVAIFFCGFGVGWQWRDLLRTIFDYRIAMAKIKAGDKTND